jgi:hypothetical protein
MGAKVLSTRRGIRAPAQLKRGGWNARCEPLETRRLLSGAAPAAPVTGFVLVDAGTGHALMPLTEGVEVNVAELPTSNLNVRADVGAGTAGSVRFAFDADNRFNTEIVKPYALFGDVGTQYNAGDLSFGPHTLSAYTTTETGGRGTAGPRSTVNFTVVDRPGSTVPPPPSVTGFTLMNADTDLPIGTLQNGDTLNLAALPTRNLNVRADIGQGQANSVRFNLDAATSLDLGPVYAVFGDVSGNFNAGTFSLGGHTLAATPCTSSTGKGRAGTGLAIAFTVVDVPPAVTGFTLINADTDEAIAPLRDGDLLDLSALPTRNLNVRADLATGFASSVGFSLGSPLPAVAPGAPEDADIDFQSVDAAPAYALFGDTGGDFAAGRFDIGMHTLDAAAFAAADGTGQSGPGNGIFFSVVDGDNLLTSVDGVACPDQSIIDFGGIADPVPPTGNAGANPVESTGPIHFSYRNVGPAPLVLDRVLSFENDPVSGAPPVELSLDGATVESDGFLDQGFGFVYTYYLRDDAILKRTEQFTDGKLVSTTYTVLEPIENPPPGPPPQDYAQSLALLVQQVFDVTVKPSGEPSVQRFAITNVAGSASVTSTGTIQTFSGTVVKLGGPGEVDVGDSTRQYTSNVTTATFLTSRTFALTNLGLQNLTINKPSPSTINFTVDRFYQITNGVATYLAPDTSFLFSPGARVYFKVKKTFGFSTQSGTVRIGNDDPDEGESPFIIKIA